MLWVLDQTVTAMGTRMLKKWLDRPLLNEQDIEDRLNIVQGFLEGFMERDLLREALKSVYDLERLAGRIAYGNVNARDLLQLKQSVAKIPEIKHVLSQFDGAGIRALDDKLQYPEYLVTLLEQSLAEDPPVSITEGSIIKDGYHEKLDKYREASRNGKQWITGLEQKEKEETGIKSLKVGFNRVLAII